MQCSWCETKISGELRYAIWDDPVPCSNGDGGVVFLPSVFLPFCSELCFRRAALALLKEDGMSGKEARQTLSESLGVGS